MVEGVESLSPVRSIGDAQHRCLRGLSAPRIGASSSIDRSMTLSLTSEVGRRRLSIDVEGSGRGGEDAGTGDDGGRSPSDSWPIDPGVSKG